jgi:predicted metallo-beta-lactamase superfamily hydrolase
MSQTMTRTQVYIQPKLLSDAKVFAKNNQINLSQLMREALLEKIKKNTKPKKTFADIKTFKAINPIEYTESWELSKKIDEIVYDL